MWYRTETVSVLVPLKALTYFRRYEMDTIKKSLEENGYDYAVAVATQAEIAAGAACGQLAIICEQ